MNATPANPVATNNSAIGDPLCDGATIQLETPFIPGATYQWVGPNGFISDLSNPIIENADIRNAGQYGVIVTIDGCSSSQDTTNVFVNDAIEIPVGVTNGPVCEGEELTFSVSNFDSTLNYTWFDSVGNVIVATGPILSLSLIHI